MADGKVERFMLSSSKGAPDEYAVRWEGGKE